MRDRDLLVQQPSPDGRTLSIHAVPYKINGRRPPIRRAAPTVGQDNERWLTKPARYEDSQK
jgi:formyl-CoA transferase